MVPAAATADYVRIKGTVVNVRQGPGTSHPALFKAEQGEEFDLVSTEGLWCRIKLPSGQEAWVFRKLVDIVEGSRAGAAPGEGQPGEQESTSGAWTRHSSKGLIVLALLIGVILVWKRRKILHYTGVRLREISGYKRDQAFRYDNRKPKDDSWEI